MKKNIRDYIHYFIGGELEENGETRVMTPLLVDRVKMYPPSIGNKKFKPVLRHLASMTPAELGEFNKINTTLFIVAEGENMIRQQAESVKFLLEKGFDVFGLIEDRIAIENPVYPRLY